MAEGTGYELVTTIKDGETTSYLDAEIAESYRVCAYKTWKSGTKDVTTYGRLCKAGKLTLADSKVKSLKKGAKKFTVKWTAAAGVTGYQICYKQSGKKAKYKTVSADKLKYTVKKLKAGKKYTVKVRGLYSAGSIDIKGPWSNAKTVKVK